MKQTLKDELLKALDAVSGVLGRIPDREWGDSGQPVQALVNQAEEFVNRLPTTSEDDPFEGMDDAGDDA